MNGAAWVKWTAFGAAVAWILGMIPSVTMGNGGEHSAPDVAQMGDLMKYTLAAVMGCVLGPVLGIPQWIVLRRHARRAGWWVAGNSAAWALGMPLIFMAASNVSPEMSPLWLAVIAGGAFTLAGAVVGAVHGLVLVWLTSRTAPAPPGKT